MIVALGLISLGYALAYYSTNVLVWAHFSTATEEPVPFAACLGFPISPRATPFMPPAQLGLMIPGAITDARGLLGGTPTTGNYAQVAAAAPAGGGSPPAASGGDAAGPPGGGPAQAGPAPSGGAPSGHPSQGTSNTLAAIGSALNGARADIAGGFRPATPDEIARVRLNPPPPGRQWVTDGEGGYTLK